jgi:hypothetical protein
MNSTEFLSAVVMALALLAPTTRRQALATSVASQARWSWCLVWELYRTGSSTRRQNDHAASRVWFRHEKVRRKWLTAMQREALGRVKRSIDVRREHRYTESWAGSWMVRHFGQGRKRLRVGSDDR